jgi:hypothetical protein
VAEQREQMRALERQEPRASLVAWFVIFGLVMAMLVETALLILLIGDRSRQYHYLSQSYIPASAYSATEPAPTTTTESPKQVELPPAVVGKRSK